MFYFTCNESKIYESFTFWNNLQEKKKLFHDILIYWDAPVYLIWLSSTKWLKPLNTQVLDINNMGSIF